ncbi:MAG: N-6 DNA methylase, partial [Candidatus Bathyarchaeia archaeon]
IAKQVLKPLPIEVETSFAIRVLRGTVHYVGEMMRRLQDKELEDIFGGKTVFENILQYEEGKYPLEQMRQAATYLLVNQLLFYHVLARVGIVKAIDEAEIKTPEDLAGYFERVLEKDYSAVFGFDVASRLPAKATEMVRNVVKIIGVLSPEKIRHDLLGKVFHELIPFDIRKAVAAFYTNNEAAEILAQLAIDKPDAKVMDLAVGSGTLLVAAYRRKRELLQKVKGTVELEDHRQFLELDLTGIDIMPFAAHLAVVHLSLQTLLYETEKVRVAVWDSTELRPEETIPAIWSELKAAYRRPTLDMFAKEKAPSKEAYITKGAITLEGVGGERIPLETVDVVIMNPPFTRQQRIPRDYKQVLAKRFTDHSQYVHGQMGYHGYFLLLANRFLKNGGRLALVLPASVLNADGFQKIRELLTNYYHVEHIVTTWQRSAFSEGAQFREILLIAKKRDRGASKDSICAISELKRLPHNLKEAREFADKIKNTVRTKGHGLVYHDEIMQVSLFTTKELGDSVDNLFKFIAFTDKKLMSVWQSIVDYAKNRLIGFGEYINQYGSGPKEGAALGQILKGGGIGALYIHRKPSKMLKKIDMWLLKDVKKNEVIVEHKVLSKVFGIPLNVLRPAMRRFSGFNSFDISTEADYIIADIFPDAKDFLSLSFRKEVDVSYLKKWNEYVDRLLGNLLFANHVNVSAPNTSILAYYSSTPTLVPRSMWSIKVPDASAKIFTLW